MITSEAKPISSTRGKDRKITATCCAVLLALHAILAFDALRQHNVSVDEGGHVLAGLIAWEYGRPDVYYVNPPLVKLIAALPLTLAEPELPDDVRHTPSVYWSGQQKQFLQANRDRYQDLILRARCMTAALSVLGGWLIFRWSNQLFGTAAGLIGVCLWSFCPNVLTWAGVATVDMGATVFGLAAVYALRHYLHHPGWLAAGWTGLLLGLAQLSKFTLLVLYPVFFFLWLLAWRPHRRTAAHWFHFALVLLISVCVINMGYGFQDVGRRLDAFSFQCHALTRDDNGPRINRFHDSWLGQFPMPLPAAFIQGLDRQKSDADADLPAYLRGQWHRGGWWYYYLYGLGVKLPLGTLTLIGLSGLLLACSSRYRRGFIDELLLWLPAAAILLLISSQTGINGHLRYVLPLFPFLFIGISRVGLLFAAFTDRFRHSRLLPRLGAVVVVASLAWNAIAAFRIHPHYLSYFNELAGGPDNGWRHLLESNIDWGQDLLFLKRWLHENPNARPLNLAYYGDIDPHWIGVDYQLPPPAASLGGTELRPGWYAVSANLVGGMACSGYDEQGNDTSFPADAYSYFRSLTPVAKAGYSIFIYRITPEDANRVRARLKQP